MSAIIAESGPRVTPAPEATPQSAIAAFNRAFPLFIRKAGSFLVHRQAGIVLYPHQERLAWDVYKVLMGVNKATGKKITLDEAPDVNNALPNNANTTWRLQIKPEREEEVDGEKVKKSFDVWITDGIAVDPILRFQRNRAESYNSSDQDKVDYALLIAASVTPEHFFNPGVSISEQSRVREVAEAYLFHNATMPNGDFRLFDDPEPEDSWRHQYHDLEFAHTDMQERRIFVPHLIRPEVFQRVYERLVPKLAEPEVAPGMGEAPRVSALTIPESTPLRKNVVFWILLAVMLGTATVTHPDSESQIAQWVSQISQNFQPPAR